MRAIVMYGAGDVRIGNVVDARIIETTDALQQVGPSPASLSRAAKQARGKLLVTIRRQTPEADDEGNVVAWGEHVSDEQYAQAPSLTEGES